MISSIIRGSMVAAVVWVGVAAAGPANVSAEASETASTEYYSTLPFRETPFAPLVGLHPLSEGEASSRNHFRFDLDADGRPVRVRFMLGENVRSLNDAANYYFLAPHLEIEYRPGAEVRKFFDENGNRIAVSGGVFTEVFSLDDRGYRRSLEFYDAEGAPVENSWGVARYEWTISHDGTVTERRIGFDGKLKELRARFPFFELRLHYGPGGWLSLMQNFGVDGKLTLNELDAAQDRLEYLANGDLRSWNVLDTEGNLSVGNTPRVARGLLEYDGYGLQTVERYEDADGKPIRNGYGFSYTRSTYDTFGNYKERANYSLDGKELLLMADRGYAGFAYEYDETGRYRELVTFFGEERQPVPHASGGFYKIRSVYNGSGYEIETRYEDQAGNLFNRVDLGFAKILRSFDDRGRLVEARFQDSAGQLVRHQRTGHAVEKRSYGEHGVATSIERFDDQGRRVE